MINLPEILALIASIDIETYRGMLAIPDFARSLTPSIRTDFMIKFGLTVKIKQKSIRWYDANGLLHRIDGPADERILDNRHNYVDHYQQIGIPIWCSSDVKDVRWYNHGLLHRMGGPAAIGRLGEFWLQNDIFHRDDGPAIIYKSGETVWFRYGKQFIPNL